MREALPILLAAELLAGCAAPVKTSEAPTVEISGESGSAPVIASNSKVTLPGKQANPFRSQEMGTHIDIMHCIRNDWKDGATFERAEKACKKSGWKAHECEKQKLSDLRKEEAEKEVGDIPPVCSKAIQYQEKLDNGLLEDRELTGFVGYQMACNKKIAANNPDGLGELNACQAEALRCISDKVRGTLAGDRCLGWHMRKESSH